MSEGQEAHKAETEDAWAERRRESLFTILLFMPEDGPYTWSGEVTNFMGKKLAFASASDWRVVIAMLETALDRELPYRSEGE